MSAVMQQAADNVEQAEEEGMPDTTSPIERLQVAVPYMHACRAPICMVRQGLKGVVHVSNPALFSCP